MAAFAIPVLGLAGTVIKEPFPDGTYWQETWECTASRKPQFRYWPVFDSLPRCAALGGIAWNTIFLSDILLSDSVGHCPR